MTRPRCPISGFRFVAFKTWIEVRHAAETNVTLYYWAPKDFAAFVFMAWPEIAWWLP